MPKKIIIDGIIGLDITANEIRGRMAAAKNEDIIIEISSPGGLVFEGLTIYNAIRDYAGNVTTRLTGLAASMASYIATAGDKLEIWDNAVFMIHNAWALAIGDYREMRKEADTLEKISRLLAKAYKKKSGKSEKEIKKLMDAETFLFGDEIVSEGFADEIIESGKNESREDAITQAELSINNCISVMRKSEKTKNEMEKIAACLGDMSDDIEESTQAQETENQDQTENDLNNETETKKSVVDAEKNQKGVKKMTKDQLKAEFPAVYNEIIAEGKEVEKKRCLTFVDAMNSLPECSEIYKDAIKNGNEGNDASVQAAVLAQVKAKKEITEDVESSTEDVLPAKNEKNEDEQVKDLTAEILNLTGRGQK